MVGWLVNAGEWIGKDTETCKQEITDYFRYMDGMIFL
jgi:hypothetical protein